MPDTFKQHLDVLVVGAGPIGLAHDVFAFTMLQELMARARSA
jgi:threonine dehydrogenase-like Zn-dependent dehydrogenase